MIGMKVSISSQTSKANTAKGTGIFRTPGTVYNFTQSIPVSMAWWALGVVAAMAGIVAYMELGHTIPIYRFGDKEVSVPRNGGELNYLKYIFRKPAFFTTCVFGLSFILLGHVAMNGIQFGILVLDAAGKGNIVNHDAVVRGIALSVAFAACFLHGTWRQGGIYLNNILAVFKIGILLMIFILGMCAVGGVFPRAAENAIDLSPRGKNVLEQTGAAYGYAEAFLAILFAFGGFNQANYVIGEIDDPRRRYKWPAFSAVAIVSVLYLLDNAAYFIVVPEQLFNPDVDPRLNVAHYLFKYTIGRRAGWEDKAPRMLSAFAAISCLGNIIVMTYTAARVKQEIAKEGILPFRRYLAGSVKARVRIPIRKLWGSKKETLPEDVPLGALVLHFTVSAILVCATWKQQVTSTYSMLVDLYSYTVDAVFSVFLGFGLLYMRFFSKRDWARHSWNSGFRIPAYVSAICGFIFGLANLYPVAAKWIPVTGELAKNLTVPWYVTGTVGWIIVFIGVLWWIGFRYVIPRFGRDRVGRVLIVIRKLWFREEDGYKVLEFEDVEFRWAAIVDDREGHGGETGDKVDNFAGGRLRERNYYAGEQEVEHRMMDEWGSAGMGGQGMRDQFLHQNPRGGVPGIPMQQMQQRSPWERQAQHHEVYAPGATPRL